MAAAIAATPADAAKRKVPFGFFGTAMSPELSDPAQVPDAALTEQMGLMARSGVETVRAYFNWARIQPARRSFDWSTTDRLVGGAARRRMAVTANVMITPPWASSRPRSATPHLYAPRDPRVLAAFMRRLVLRYGPRGTFWAANPALPRVPVRQWQLYNEQMAPWMWKSRPWAKVYTPLLKAAYPAIHRADRGARVVAGSLVHVGRFSPWDGMRALYEAGAKRYFDVVAIHPFTNDDRSVRRTVDQVIDIVDFVRDRMRTFHDARKPVILTELTWSAAVGKLPESSLTGLETTPKGTGRPDEGGVPAAGQGAAQASDHRDLLVHLGDPVRRELRAGSLVPLRRPDAVEGRGVLADADPACVRKPGGPLRRVPQDLERTPMPLAEWPRQPARGT